MTQYRLAYADDGGNELMELDPISFEYVLVYGDVGWLTVALPYRRNALYATGNVDYQVHAYRDGQLEGVFFARRWSYPTEGGFTKVEISAADPNYLLTSRIVARYAGTDEADQSAAADDMMKAIVRNAFTAGTDYDGAETDRDISDIGFSVDADSSDGPSIDKGFSWRGVLRTLQNIQADSKAEGTEVFFNVVATSPTTFNFTTYTGQPGSDRTLDDGSNPLVFAPQWGNLVDPFYGEDYSDEQNFIYAGGQGQGTARNVQEASDTDRINASQWNRREGFVQSQGKTDATVSASARSRLAERRPQKIFRGTILSTQETPYGGGGGWRVGDRVTAMYTGKQFNTIVRSVSVGVNERGRESVTARVESSA